MPQRDGSGIAFVRPKDFVHAAYGLSPVLRVMVRSGAEKRILPLLSKFPHHIFRVRGSDKPSVVVNRSCPSRLLQSEERCRAACQSARGRLRGAAQTAAEAPSGRREALAVGDSDVGGGEVTIGAVPTSLLQNGIIIIHSLPMRIRWDETKRQQVLGAHPLVL
jgi:hypothetical protein